MPNKKSRKKGVVLGRGYLVASDNMNVGLTTNKEEGAPNYFGTLNGLKSLRFSSVEGKFGKIIFYPED